MSEWTWEYEGYDPAEETLRESLCSLGNGYFATRGAAPECPAGGPHYPGTYAAGVYNRLTSEVAGQTVSNEDMVNLPNWLPLRYRLSPPGGGSGTDWYTPDDAALRSYRQLLDLRAGIYERHLVYEDASGRRLRVRQFRVVHMDDPHLAALRTEFTAENFDGTLEVESAIDAGVTNDGVARYRELNGQHLAEIMSGYPEDCTVWVRARTVNSGITVAVAARTYSSEGPACEPRPSTGTPTRPATRINLTLKQGETAAVDKIVALHTSRDSAISDPLDAALDGVRNVPGWDELLLDHRLAWQRLWHRALLEVPDEAGHILRFHLFHVLQTVSPHTADLDAGVPARGLNGEAYRGHVFWDELFVLPYLNLHFPEVSKGLLRYRHRRLDRARRLARDAGFDGAMYPWQSGSDGREETQELHLNPSSGRWLPDNSRLQHHIGSAVAYNVWSYARATGDARFMEHEGAEMLLQISRFWASKSEWDGDLGRYRIRRVVGPDEYHDAYPDATEPGLDDNAYTNVTAAWVLQRTLESLAALPEERRAELAEHTGLDDTELAHWDDISRRLHVPFHQGVVSQFEGYGELRELDWVGMSTKYGDIRRLDRVLEAEGDSVNRYQASKQADTLMLGYLFPPRELRALFARLGHRLDDETWRRTVDYYVARTSHGSTLSGLVHAWVLARVRPTQAWGFFQEALRGDVADLQGGTTGEGIHLGAMAGTLDLVQRCLTGLRIRSDGALGLDPVPQPELSGYDFAIHYRHLWGVRFRMRSGGLDISLPESNRPSLDIRLVDRTVTLRPGDSFHLTLPEGD
ncbi:MULTISPECIES: glycoside hydrolase family 65 protein [unclassified Streptomyces]|uniref:glycoside hydrolase family 65 protein n=1 Tax=unclassified Streptomyces TaxID=2593676 RepID=UPI0037FAC2B7